MIRKSILIAATAAWLTIFPDLANAESDPYTRDILILTQWFEGEFDNEEQLWFEKYPDSGVAEDAYHDRLHVMHRRLDLPALGDHVFYVEEYANHDPAKIIRQRIVTFQTDPGAAAIRMQQGFFRDSNAAQGSYFNPRKLENLTKEDVFFMKDLDPTLECDVLWKRDGEQFKGAIASKACQFGEGAKRRYSVHHLTLARDTYIRVDASRRVSDDVITVGHPEDQPHIMKRALPFTCSGRFFSNPDATSDGDNMSIQRFADKRIHSQGGTFQVTRESDGKIFEGLMRTKQYPFYSERPNFIYFSFREAGAERSTAFAVTDNLSRQIGITLPGMSMHCHRVGYNFDESYELLDEAAP